MGWHVRMSQAKRVILNLRDSNIAPVDVWKPQYLARHNAERRKLHSGSPRTRAYTEAKGGAAVISIAAINADLWSIVARTVIAALVGVVVFVVLVITRLNVAPWMRAIAIAVIVTHHVRAHQRRALRNV